MSSKTRIPTRKTEHHVGTRHVYCMHLSWRGTSCTLKPTLSNGCNPSTPQKTKIHSSSFPRLFSSLPRESSLHFTSSATLSGTYNLHFLHHSSLQIITTNLTSVLCFSLPSICSSFSRWPVDKRSHTQLITDPVWSKRSSWESLSVY